MNKTWGNSAKSCTLRIADIKYRNTYAVTPYKTTYPPQHKE